MRRLWGMAVLVVVLMAVAGCDDAVTPPPDLPVLTPNPAQVAQTITALAVLLTPGAVPPTAAITPVLVTPTPSAPTYDDYAAWWARHGGVAIAQPGFTPVAGLAPFAPQTPPSVPNLPPLPGTLDDYPAALAKYLATLPDAKAGDVPTVQAGAAKRLKEALEGWRAIGPEGVVAAVDLDRDGVADIVATAWQPDPAAKTLPSSTTNPPGIVFVLHGGKDGGWTPILYRKGATANPAQRDFVAPLIVQAGSITKSGQVAIVFTETTCGPQNCIETVHAVAPFVNGVFRELTPDLPTMAYPAISLSDLDHTGDLALLLRGNIWPAANAGLQRERTDIYRWDVRDLVYKLSETRNAPSPYLFHTILDANAALGMRNYALAMRLYTQAASDDSLKLWNADTNGAAAQTEQQVLRAFARFRLALTQAVMGDRKGALATLNDASQRDGEYAGWARAFLGVYNTVGDTNTGYALAAYLFPTIVVPTSPTATSVPPPTPTAVATATATSTPRPTAAKTSPRPTPPATTPTPPPAPPINPPDTTPPTETPAAPTIATTPGQPVTPPADGTGIGVAHPLSLTPLLKSACQAAIRYSGDHPDLIAPLNQFGPTNPFFAPQDICPAFA